ncbi:MAG: DUF4365 domain-containing protein [Planctomycetota bacterium]
MTDDSLPRENLNRELEDEAEAVFSLEVVRSGQFVIQSRDRHDAGVDLTLEAIENGKHTNVRVLAQLKGTTRAENADGTVSVSVAISNVTYLGQQPFSFYVCFHRPTGRLLVRTAESVLTEVDGKPDQATIAIRFSESFDAEWKNHIHTQAIMATHARRLHASKWKYLARAEAGSHKTALPEYIDVPPGKDDASQLLVRLYELGEDQLISAGFEQFIASLGWGHPALRYVYMAEINLGSRHRAFCRQRIEDAIAFLSRDSDFHPASRNYCIGNAHATIGQYAEACDAFRKAIGFGGSQSGVSEGSPAESGEGLPGNSFMSQVWKNFGSSLLEVDKPEEAFDAFQYAVSLNPSLAEGWYSLGSMRLERGDVEDADRFYSKAIRLSDRDMALGAHGRRAIARIEGGRLCDALDDLIQIMQHRPMPDWGPGFILNFFEAYSVNDTPQAGCLDEFKASAAQLVPEFAELHKALARW